MSYWDHNFWKGWLYGFGFMAGAGTFMGLLALMWKAAG